jgi:hypothetical protein
MTTRNNYKTKAQRHADFFLSQVDIPGSLHKFTESFLKSARKDDKVGKVLQEQLTWIKEERNKLYKKLQKEPLARLDGLKSPVEEKIIAVLYMNLSRNMQSKGANFDALLHAVKTDSSKIIDGLNTIETDFIFELLMEVERRSAIDLSFRDQLEKSSRDFGDFLSRITPLVTEFNNDSDCEETPDIVFLLDPITIGTIVVGSIGLGLIIYDRVATKDDD